MKRTTLTALVVVVVGALAPGMAAAAEPPSPVTLDSEATCQWLDGDDPSGPIDYTVLEWDSDTRTCTVIPTGSPALAALRPLGGGDVLIIPDGVTLRTEDALFGSVVLRVEHGVVINHGTLAVPLSVGADAVASNWGTMTRGFAVRGTVVNQEDGTIAIHSGSITNRGGSIINESLIELTGDGGILGGGQWVDEENALVQNRGTVRNLWPPPIAGYPTHVITGGATFNNFGSYELGPATGGPPMEIFDDGTFDNFGSFTSTGGALHIDSPLSPIGGEGPAPGGGRFVNECDSTFDYPSDQFLGDSPLFVCDRDGDGVPDIDDAFPDDASEAVDTDGDGIGDNADPDDDGDGQTDTDEIVCGSDPLDAASLSPDFDGDTSPDCVDPDDDGDGVNDAEDAVPLSDTSPTITLGDADTGVANLVLPDGSTFNDRIGEAIDAGGDRGMIVARITRLTNEWRTIGMMTGRSAGRVQATAAATL